MTPLARIRRRPLLFAGFALALALTLFFAVRLVVFTLLWSDPAMRNQPIEAWMTPGYIAHSWHVPREVIVEALGRPDPESRGLTLAEIAEARGATEAELVAALDAAIAAYRAGLP